MENRRKRWYDLFGLLPRNLGRLLLWFSLIPIAFIIVLYWENAGKTEWGYSGAIMVVTTQNGSSHAKLNTKHLHRS